MKAIVSKFSILFQFRNSLLYLNVDYSVESYVIQVLLLNNFIQDYVEWKLHIFVDGERGVE